MWARHHFILDREIYWNPKSNKVITSFFMNKLAIFYLRSYDNLVRFRNCKPKHCATAHREPFVYGAYYSYRLFYLLGY